MHSLANHNTQVDDSYSQMCHLTTCVVILIGSLVGNMLTVQMVDFRFSP